MGDASEEKTQVRSMIRGGGVPIQYPMLNDTNYGLLVVKIKIVLKALRVRDEVEGKRLVDKEKDQGAMAAISRAMPDFIVMAIAENKTAKVAWETIKQMVVGEDRVRKARAHVLKRQVDCMNMSDIASIVEFSQKLIGMEGEIQYLGVELKDDVVVERLFSAVPDKFLSIVGTIEQWGDTSSVTIAKVIGWLRVFEEGLKG